MQAGWGEVLPSGLTLLHLQWRLRWVKVQPPVKAGWVPSSFFWMDSLAPPVKAGWVQSSPCWMDSLSPLVKAWWDWSYSCWMDSLTPSVNAEWGQVLPAGWTLLHLQWMLGGVKVFPVVWTLMDSNSINWLYKNYVLVKEWCVHMLTVFLKLFLLV